MNSEEQSKLNDLKFGNSKTETEAEIVKIKFPSHYPFNNMICRAEHAELFCQLFKEGIPIKVKRRSRPASNIDLKGKSGKDVDIE